MNDYSLEADGEFRCNLELPLDDVLRLAQALANTEGCDVTIVNGVKTVGHVVGDETKYPEISFAERCQIVTGSVLREMLRDAESQHEMAWTSVKSIIDELDRRADR